MGFLSSTWEVPKQLKLTDNLVIKPAGIAAEFGLCRCLIWSLCWGKGAQMNRICCSRGSEINVFTQKNSMFEWSEIETWVCWFEACIKIDVFLQNKGISQLSTEGSCSHSFCWHEENLNGLQSCRHWCVCLVVNEAARSWTKRNWVSVAFDKTLHVYKKVQYTWKS